MRYMATMSYAGEFRKYVADQAAHLNVRPRRAMASRHQGFLRDVDLCSVEELAVDPIYEKYLRPVGVGWTIGTVLPVPGGDVLAFEIGRSSADGPFDLATAELLDRFRPHLARAAHIAARLGMMQARSMVAGLAAVGLPAAVLKADRSVVAANPPFEALSPRISISAGNKLQIADPRAESLSQAEFANILDRDAAIVRSIPIGATESEPPLILHLTPIRRAAHDIFGNAHWIAVVTPVTPGPLPEADLLQGLFDLTAAEARVARLIAAGATADEISVRNAVSINTVRTQIRSVLAKTGLGRQADLVAMLASAAVPFA